MIRLEIVDTLLDFHRAARKGFIEPLGDGFQWPDVLDMIQGLKDNDGDNKNGTIIEGFIKDLPLFVQDFRQMSVVDAQETVGAVIGSINAEFPAPNGFTAFFMGFLNNLVGTYAYIDSVILGGQKLVLQWGELLPKKNIV